MAVESVDRASRLFVILNPCAGGIALELVRAALQRHCAAGDSCYELHEAAESDDLAAIARAAVGRGFDLVAAAGGDGTVSAVANGMIASTARLGIIPLGTANVLARELAIPLDLDAACRVLAGSNATVCIDAMRIGEAHYLTQIGAGVDALMVRDTTAASKRRFGSLAYAWTAAVWLVGLQPHRFSIAADARKVRPRASQVVVANCGTLGTSGLRWGQDVRPDDGRLDVGIVRARSASNYLSVVWSVLRGRHGEDRNIHYLTAEHTVAIHSDEPLPVQADGEIIGATPLEITLVPRALRVVVPIAPGD